MLLFAASSVGAADDREITDLQHVNKLLQAEYALAKTGNPYLLIDLQAQRVYVKASGVVLESLEIDNSRSWGSPTGLPAANLVNKSSFAEPERNVQVVNGQPVVAQPFNALELADMPTSYRLYLDNGTEISVSTMQNGWFSRLYRTINAAAWFLARPLISNWNYLYGRPYNVLALSLPEQDARMLYWAFSEGTPCLIGFPSAVPAKAP